MATDVGAETALPVLHRSKGHKEQTSALFGVFGEKVVPSRLFLSNKFSRRVGGTILIVVDLIQTEVFLCEINIINGEPYVEIDGRVGGKPSTLRDCFVTITIFAMSSASAPYIFFIFHYTINLLVEHKAWSVLPWPSTSQ